MLSAKAYSFTMQSRLAISLSWIAGYTNVFALLLCGDMVSHTTGTVTHLGYAIASEHHTHVKFFALVFACFLFGACLSGLLTERARAQGVRSKYILPMAIEALLMTAFSLLLVRNGGTGDGSQKYVMTVLASVAMGLQNATITKISGATVRTTHLTGVTTDLGLESMQFFVWWWRKWRTLRAARTGRLLRISRRHPSAMRIALLASIFGSFLFGVAAGTYIFEHYRAVALVPGVLFLLWIIFVDWYKPISGVQELDLLSDPELASFGIVKSLLPPELGVYRMTVPHGQRAHVAPNFQGWVERMPRHTHVLILAVSPLMRLDRESIANLHAAVTLLSSQKRRLILAGVVPAQYRALSAEGVHRVLDVEDLCPDLEFAVARGIELVRHVREERLMVRIDD